LQAALPLLGKWEAIVASHPKLKGPNATPTAAVQTISGLHTQEQDKLKV
jgi:hypothetical protein